MFDLRTADPWILIGWFVLGGLVGMVAAWSMTACLTLLDVLRRFVAWRWFRLQWAWARLKGVRRAPKPFQVWQARPSGPYEEIKKFYILEPRRQGDAAFVQYTTVPPWQSPIYSGPGASRDAPKWDWRFSSDCTEVTIEEWRALVLKEDLLLLQGADWREPRDRSIF